MSKHPQRACISELVKKSGGAAATLQKRLVSKYPGLIKIVKVQQRDQLPPPPGQPGGMQKVWRGDVPWMRFEDGRLKALKPKEIASLERPGLVYWTSSPSKQPREPLSTSTAA